MGLKGLGPGSKLQGPGGDSIPLPYGNALSGASPKHSPMLSPMLSTNPSLVAPPPKPSPMFYCGHRAGERLQVSPLEEGSGQAAPCAISQQLRDEGDSDSAGKSTLVRVRAACLQAG